MSSNLLDIISRNDSLPGRQRESSNHIEKTGFTHPARKRHRNPRHHPKVRRRFLRNPLPSRLHHEKSGDSSWNEEKSWRRVFTFVTHTRFKYYLEAEVHFFNSGLHHPYPPPDEGMKISAQKKAKTQYPMILFYHSPMKPPFSCEYVVFCDKYILILKES